MKAYISQLIKNKTNRYLEDYNEMLGDYNREQETIKGYNGRQILELLQNCDDEGAKEVLISLDTNNQVITISNDGTPFSEDGYLSLFIANLSSKQSKRKYIGNKGLGFRSIINWAKRIEIHSNNIAVIYSEENRKKAFNQLFDAAKQAEIRSKRKLKASVIPMPFLAMPELTESTRDKFVTSIVIHYKSAFQDQIVDQVIGLKPETILFLKHIEKIRFEGFASKNDFDCIKKNLPVKKGSISPLQEIQYDDLIWEVFGIEEDLPPNLQESDHQEKEFYQIKIAVEKNLAKTSKYLYSFFPTKIQLSQPYILHATFDLDPTRNQIVDSEKNKFILQKAVDFTIAVAKYYAGKKVSYRPLEILSFTHKADTLDGLGYYDLISKALRAENIFPCIDNRYRKLSEVFYLSDDFGVFIKNIGAVHLLGWHLIPFNDTQIASVLQKLNISWYMDDAGIGPEQMNAIARLPLTNKQRARLIYYITEYAPSVENNAEEQYDILTNENDKVIKGTEYIYTPITQNELLKTPSYTKIQFINRQLYNELLKAFDYQEARHAGKPRFIYEKLKDYCNVHSYEPATLAQKIISETNTVLEKDKENQVVLVQEMNSCLLHNFIRISGRTSISPLKGNIPSIAADLHVKPANALILSPVYPGGYVANDIFSNIYTNADYVGSPEILGIGEYDLQTVESYLMWINVNKFAVYRKSADIADKYNYSRYVLKNKEIINTSGYDLEVKEINKFRNILKRISLNQLLLWIYFDEQLKKQISDRLNDDVFRNYFRNYTTIIEKPSYIKFQIKTYFEVNFSRLLLDERYSWANDITIDYSAIEFKKYGISKSTINDMLINLGATDDFNTLPIERVEEIINKVPKVFRDGRHSQTVYKSALAHYKVNHMKIPGQTKLFANTGNELEVMASKRVYFSDKVKLPSRLKKEFPVFNFPARAGGADAINFFGINDLKTVSIEVKQYSEITYLTAEFNNNIELLKPCLLTIRINQVEDISQRKSIAAICGKLRLLFCNHIRYEVKNKEYEAIDYEYVVLKEHTFLVKIPDSETYESLKKSAQFADCFAEIVSLSFDVTGEKSDYRNLLRWDYNEVIAHIQADFGEDTYKLALELLGQANHKFSFWNAIFELKGIVHPEHWTDSEIEKLIFENFDLLFDPSSINYDHLTADSELIKIKVLFSKLMIDLPVFQDYYPYPITMEAYHANQLKNAILSKKNIVKTSLWVLYEQRDIEHQAKFLAEINRLEDYFEYAGTIAAQYKHSFDLPVEDLTNTFINQLYGKLDTPPNIDLEEIKQTNLKKFNTDERYMISQDETLKSLIYFPQNIEYIRKIITDLDIENRTDNPDIHIENKMPVSIISSEKLTPNTLSGNTLNKKKGVFTPKEESDKKKKTKGITSEEIVYNFMRSKSEFKNVDLVSHDNEGLHYDIRYTTDQGIVKYVEVKTFDNDNFILSRAQYEFGIKHKDDYEIWLVSNESRIIPIRDFFTNEKYKPVIKDYIVYLQLDKTTVF